MPGSPGSDPAQDVSSPLELLLREAAGFPLLTAEEERDMGRRIREGRLAADELRRDDLTPEQRARLEAAVAAGEAARRRFVAANQRLVVSVARRYRDRRLDLEDLVQEGNLGLLRAIERFDPERGLKFSTYAVWWIKQAIQRALDDSSRLIRLPSHAAEEAGRLWRMADRLAAELGGSPDLVEVAGAAGVHRDRAVALARATLQPISLEAVVGAEEGTALAELLAGELEGPDEVLERSAIADMVRQGLAELPARQRRVLEMRFGLDGSPSRSLTEVGEALGVSRERARQLEVDGLRRLRQVLRRLRLLIGDA